MPAGQGFWKLNLRPKPSGRRSPPNLQPYVALVRGKVESAKIIEEIRCLIFNSPIQLVDGGETDHSFPFQRDDTFDKVIDIYPFGQCLLTTYRFLQIRHVFL